MPSERYDLKNIDEAFKIIEDDALKEIYKKHSSNFEEKRDFSGIYISKKEILNSIKERIFDAFEEKFKEIKYNISQLRKKGFEVNVLDFDLLRFPFKKKMLDSDFSMDNYEVIMNLFSGIEPEINKMICEMESAEKEHDAKEKEIARKLREK